jgi:hypothetical protein
MTQDRQAKFLWMQDLVEHLSYCVEQWQAADGPSEHYLGDHIKRDLDELRRVTEALQTAREAAVHELAVLRSC